MANVYLKKLGSSTTDSIVLASAADVFGDAFGQEELFIIPNGATFPTGIVVEQTIEKITLNGALSDYTFAKLGTTDVLVYRDGALVATIRPQTDDDVGGDGTALEFTSGSVLSTTLNLVSATEIRIGGISGQVLTTTAEAFVAAPTTITLGLGVNEVALTAGVDTVVVAFGVDGVTAVAAVAEVVGVTAVAAVAEILAVAAPTVPTSVATDGDPVSFEVSTLTFSDLIAGQSVTVADYTLTATGNVSAAEVAAAFNGSAPVNSSFTGSLASWTVTSVSGAEVSFTHSVVGNVADLAATTAGVTAVAAVAEVVGVEAVAGVAEVVGVEAVFSHSTLAAMDTMTGFVIGTDKIDLLGLADAAVGAPNAMIRVADIDTSDDLAATLDTAFNGSAANQAGLVIISAGTAAGTYLYVNDATVDYSTTADVFIKLIGLTGTVGDVNTDLNVSDYFAV